MAMQISVTDAKAQLTELVRRTEAGDEIVLTRHGQPVAKLVKIRAARDRKTRRGAVAAMRQAARSQALQELTPEQYRDLLFGGAGLPEWTRLRRR
jgi:prevent-host-death family protein